ncbi:uncharacterized protein LOC126374292 isoform X2 [Pectinophora gossypiella]|uniref:uncharacterized protein LOC126374292 isoform X2 n=1 Tax=Pectinophora gossypiella TaxID=13191 RepID=UPI00214E39E9|nr:uncharacterized protein LOC126374292 isoform X2 [Pectinophora gossypiella]
MLQEPLLSQHRRHLPAHYVLLPSEHSTTVSSLSENGASQQLPVLHTQFGYVIAGSIPTNQHSSQVTSLFCNTCDTSLSDTLSSFWESERVPEFFPEKLPEYETCEQMFCNSVNLDTQNNKFEVALPLKLPLESINETLGQTFNLALKRYLNLEARFQRDPELHKLYSEFIHEYVQQGHGTFVDISQYNLDSDPVYFLSHHAILRPDKKTTKCRVVFDASMKSNKKVSLNDLLLNGPVVQKDLIDILLLFRTGEFIFVTDIKAMFRNISLAQKYRSLQNILWRDTPKENIQCIQLNTVTYGLKSSSYLATRCLKELAVRYREQFPLAAHIIEHSTYVDDALVSHDSSELLIESKRQLCTLLGIGGFHLHKWYSNCTSLLDDIPKSQQHFDDIELGKDNDASLKTLGISYNINTDSFMLSSPSTNENMPTTKRDILSFIGKFYDPLGYAGPILVTSKAIMQQLWLAKVGWDERPPDELLKVWCEFFDSLQVMSPITIARHVGVCNARSVQIIGFADASSTTAYGCCIYLRVTDKTGKVKISLLCSRSRVNPIRQSLTVPRLELNAAVMLAKLVVRVYDTLHHKLNIGDVHLYSDSQIVLAWIKTNITSLNTYVGNRVKVITQLTHQYRWSYIRSEDNPADCLSRGVLPSELHNHPLWWEGPEFLHKGEYTLMDMPQLPVPGELPEIKACAVFSGSLVCMVSSTNEQLLQLDFLDKYSDINKMQRILAYILRFIQNVRSNSAKNNLNYISSKELNDSLLLIIKYEQQKYLKEDIHNLKCKQSILKGNLKPLCPFLDNKGLVRVGGRLENSSMPYSQKHPVVLPRDSRVTHLIIHAEHIKNLHAGPRVVLSTINQRFWIVHGMREIKKVLHKCITCFKLKANSAKQLMGTLPHDRVNACRPFQKVGLDFAGPIIIKQSRIRRSLETKAYVCVFVCFVTKAIHLELASDLKTETFLACLKRFISRRGVPTDIYSDNASTFRSASSQLNNLYKLQSSNEHQAKLHAFSSQRGITFHFVPCYSPTFAGLAEAGVKSMKFHLKRVVQTAILTYEELNTVLCQIESILNSRPLMPLSSDINDYSCLTPGHFLIGTALNAYPESGEPVVIVNRLKFWKQCSNITNSFWKVWSKQYLNILQTRSKWRDIQPNVQVGTLVLLKEDSTAPMQWPLARVIQTFPGNDNRVRVVEVKTANGRTHKRSVVKICPLPIE